MTYNCGEPALPSDRKSLGRKVSEALATIYADENLERVNFYGPGRVDVQAAWDTLWEPIKGYTKALVSARKTYPLWRQASELSSSDWLAGLEAKAATDYEPVIEAIIRGIELVATKSVTTVIADRAKLRGPHYLDLSNDGEIEKKVHVCDGQAPESRALFLQCLQVEGESLRLRGYHDGAKLAIATIEDSKWEIKKGWLISGHRGGGGARRRNGSASNDGEDGTSQAQIESPKPSV